MWFELLPSRDRRWPRWGLLGAAITTMAVIVLTRLITGRPLLPITELIQAFFAGYMFFLMYFAVLSAAGFFGWRTMAYAMYVGLALGVLALFFFAWRDDTGWGGLAAVAALLQIIILSTVGGLGAELGVRLWDRFRR